MYAVRYGDPCYLIIVVQFTALAVELGYVLVVLVVAWVVFYFGVTSVLIGGRNFEQLVLTLVVNQLVLDDAIRARISALSFEPPLATDRNEEVTAHNYGTRQFARTTSRSHAR